MREIIFLLFGMATAVPPPAQFVADVSAARIDPETYDLTSTGLWSLTPVERSQWALSVFQALAIDDLNSGCGAENLRRGRALMWMNLVQGSPDAQTWQVNAEALRARLRELETRLQAVQDKAPRHDDPRVTELERRVAVDQEARNNLFNAQWQSSLPALAEQSWSGVLGSHLWDVDCGNTAWLGQQMAEIGWFEIGKYGAAADKNAWLLVQHADRSKEFQRQTLAMLESLPPGKTDPRNLAFLHDRVAMGEGRPQRYGTQGQCQPDGTWKPNRSEDPAGVDARRKALGLAPLAEHALSFKDVCKSAAR